MEHSTTLKVLLPFQKEGVEYLQKNKTALLADEMGLGKSAQALCALPTDAAVVILVPAFLRYTWKREVNTWRPDLKVTIVDKRSFSFPSRGEIIICSYDSVPPLPGIRCTHIICDEAHHLKNIRTKRYKKLYPIASAQRSLDGFLWLLTGTPLLNNPPELWAIARFLGWEKFLFGGYNGFIHSFRGFWNGKYMVWGTPDPTISRKVSQKVLRRTKKEVLPSLSPKTYRQIFVAPPSKKHYDYCTEIFEGYSDVLEKTEIMEQRSFPFSAFSRAMAILAEGKIKELHQVIHEFESSNEPVIVFSAHVKPVISFAGRKGWGCITGDTPTDVRESIVQDFQEGRLLGIAATIQAAGVGLTMTRASNVVFCDPSFTPALNAQAEDRVHRIGQERNCVITYLICDHPLDISLHRILVRKTRLFAEIFNFPSKDLSYDS